MGRASAQQIRKGIPPGSSLLHRSISPGRHCPSSWHRRRLLSSRRRHGSHALHGHLERPRHRLCWLRETSQQVRLRLLMLERSWGAIQGVQVHESRCLLLRWRRH